MNNTEENRENEETENEAEPKPSEEDKRIWTLSDYWEYVDLVLCELRAKVCKTERTIAGHMKHIEMHDFAISALSPLTGFLKVFHGQFAGRHEGIFWHLLMPHHACL